MDIIKKLKARLRNIPDMLFDRWSPVRAEYVCEIALTKAERDALLALVEPKTCSTCEWWVGGSGAAVGRCDSEKLRSHVFAVAVRDGEVLCDGTGTDFHIGTEATFSCALHEPAPPSPRPAPSSEEKGAAL